MCIASIAHLYEGAIQIEVGRVHALLGVEKVGVLQLFYGVGYVGNDVSGQALLAFVIAEAVWVRNGTFTAAVFMVIFEAKGIKAHGEETHNNECQSVHFVSFKRIYDEVL